MMEVSSCLFGPHIEIFSVIGNMFWNLNNAYTFHVNDKWKTAESIHKQVEYSQMFGVEIHQVAARSGLCVCGKLTYVISCR